MAENQVTISYKTIGLGDLKNAAELIAQTGRQAETTGQAYDALGAAVLRTLKADKQLSTEMRKLNKDRQAGKIGLKEYIRAEEELYRVRGETINRDKELIRIEQSREKNRQKEAADLERLREKYDSEYAAQKKYNQAIIDINRSLGQGSVKAEKAIAAVTNEYKEFVRATKTGDVINAGNQFARFGDQAYRSQQRIKRFASVGLQQAGYQVGDFIVQIQSGQNALVALGQQGSQLAGIFGTGGAVAGAIIAGITAIGMIVWEAYKASNNIKTLDEAFSDLGDTIGKLSDAQENLRSKDLNETYGNYTSLIKQVSAAAEEANKKLGELNLTALTNTLVNQDKVSVWKPAMFGGLSISDYLDAGFDVDRAKSQKQADTMSKDLGIGYGQVLTYMKKLSTATGDELVTVGTEFLDVIKESSNGFQKTNTTGLAFVATLQQAVEQTAELLALSNGSAAAGVKANKDLEERLKLLEEAEEAEAKAAEYTTDTVTQLNNQAAVLATSIKSKTAIAALDRQLFLAAQAGKVESADQLKAIMAAYDNLQKVTGETEAFKEEAKRTQDVLEKIDGVISRIRGNISSLETSGIGEKARLTALKAGKSIEESKLAGQIAEKRAAFYASAPADIPNGSMSQGEELLEREIALMITNAALATQIKDIEDKIRDSKKKTKKEQQDALEKAYEQLSFEREVLKTSKDRRLAIQALGKDYKDFTEQQILALNKELELNEQIKQSQEIADFAAGAFGDAFMSIVDGTSSVKDAFKSMASAIIKELLNVLVVQEMVNALAGAIRGGSAGAGTAPTSVPAPLPRPSVHANGNAFYGGNVIPFAKGGVVGSPMMFPMAGGNTGLMGEAGPEAIMPLKRGKGGKLGVVAENSGNVVINQNFNFSANGDESVKKIIAQAAPQIAEMTKTSIINDRRRGGSTKAAFG